MTTADQATSTFAPEGTTTPIMANSDPELKTPLTTPVADMDAVFKDQLQSITNESGEQKYKDVATALAALRHTQDHVRNLESENSQYREEGIKAKTMDEVLAQIDTTRSNQTELTNSTGTSDVEALRNVALEAIRDHEAGKSASSNQREVASRLTEKFLTEDKAQEAFVQKAQDLGMTVAQLDALVKTSPKAVLEFFQVTSKENNSKIVEGSVNTSALDATSTPNPAKKNIMYGASTQDIVQAWRDAGQTT